MVYDSEVVFSKNPTDPTVSRAVSMLIDVGARWNCGVPALCCHQRLGVVLPTEKGWDDSDDLVASWPPLKQQKKITRKSQRWMKSDVCDFLLFFFMFLYRIIVQTFAVSPWAQAARARDQSSPTRGASSNAIIIINHPSSHPRNHKLYKPQLEIVYSVYSWV